MRDRASGTVSTSLSEGQGQWYCKYKLSESEGQGQWYCKYKTGPVVL